MSALGLRLAWRKRPEWGALLTGCFDLIQDVQEFTEKVQELPSKIHQH
jgi:hypothetical protein